MLMLDGLEYDVKTPAENVDDLVSYINDYCESNNIKNSHGEVIRIEANEANPLYQVCFGLSYLTTILQKLIYNAGCSVSIPEASERQLLNLADIAGIRRSNATKTIIVATVYATDDPSGDNCIISSDPETGAYATVTIAGASVVFRPAYDVTIPPGSAKQVVLVADQYGSYNIAANTITQFDEPIPNFRYMITRASTPGQDVEPISSLRERLQRRVVEGTQVDRAATAIQNLEGIALCNIYFNYSPSETESLVYGEGTISVAPRTAVVLVQGWNQDIAKVFYRYLICETSGSVAEGAVQQNYVTKAGQSLPVFIFPPVDQAVFVKIYVNNTLSYEQENGIKDAVCSLAGSLSIGKTLDSVDVISVVRENYSNLEIQGAEISLTGETGSWSYRQTPAATAVFALNVENITVVSVA